MFRKKVVILAAMLVCMALLFVKTDSIIADGITTKQFHWGLETWQMGDQQFKIKINEKNPVRIKKIYGNLTAGPQPNHKPADMLIRQTLACLTYPGNSLDKDQIIVESSPEQRFNHGVDHNLLALNVKQTGAETMDIPINATYENPITLPTNELIFDVFNESYRHDSEKGSFVSKDEFDALNVEIHVIIEYEAQ